MLKLMHDNGWHGLLYQNETDQFKNQLNFNI